MKPFLHGPTAILLFLGNLLLPPGAPGEAITGRPPFIVRDLWDQEITEGETVQWTIIVEGRPPLHFQWHHNGTPLPRETGRSLVIPIVQPGDAGRYHLTIRNDAGTTFSRFATLTVLPRPNAARPGHPDSGFVGYTDSVIRSILVQPDGRILIGGFLNEVNNQLLQTLVARLHPDGTLDDTFAMNSLGRSVYDMALDENGSILLGGDFHQIRGVPRRSVARLLTDGSLDPSFHPGAGANGQVRQIIRQPDGAILIAGDFSEVDGFPLSGIARLEPDGRLDTSFFPGAGLNGMVRAMVLLSDGKIVIGGLFTQVDYLDRPYLARLFSDGTLDTFFPMNQNGPDGPVYALTCLNDMIWVGGLFTLINGRPMAGLARLHPDGSLDDTFQWTGPALGGPIYTIQPHPYGQVLLGGAFTNVAGQVHQRICQLQANGSLDPGFDSGSGADHWILDAAIDQDGFYLVGGSFLSFDGRPHRSLARVYPQPGPRLYWQALTNGLIQLRWTTNISGFVLQEKSLSEGAEWSPVAGPYERTGSDFRVRRPAQAQGNRAYRLFQPSSAP